MSRGEKTGTQTQLVEVTESLAAAGRDRRLEVEFPDGIVLRIPEEFDAESLVAVIEALRPC